MNVDYDPVKAHEYYEKHKKLKGRKRASTKGFSQKQLEQTEYAKSQLAKRYKKNVEQISDAAKMRLEDVRTEKLKQKDALVKEASQKIAALREKYMSASPEEQDAMRKQISDAVLKLREKTKAKVGMMSESLASESKKIQKETTKKVEKAKKKLEKNEDKAVEKIRSGA